MVAYDIVVTYEPILHVEAQLIDFFIYLSFYKDLSECYNECP